MLRLCNEVSITAKAGNGGNGSSSYRVIAKRKFVYDGGNGGKGGSVFICCDGTIDTLFSLKNRKFVAQNGENGSRSDRNGVKGKDLHICLPDNTSIYSPTGELLKTICYGDEPFKLLEGGRGGVGSAANKHLKERSGAYTEEVVFRLANSIRSDVCVVNFGEDLYCNAQTLEGLNLKGKLNEPSIVTLVLHYKLYKIVFFPFYKESFVQHMQHTKKVICFGPKEKVLNTLDASLKQKLEYIEELNIDKIKEIILNLAD